MYHVALSLFLLMAKIEILRKNVYCFLLVASCFRLFTLFNIIIFDFKVPLSKVESYLPLINKNVCFKAPGEMNGA